MPIPYEQPPRDTEPRPRSDEDRPDLEPEQDAEFDQASRSGAEQTEPTDEDDDAGWPDRVKQPDR